MCEHNGLNFPCGNCYSFRPPYVRSCDPYCNNTGCPLQLDASCVIYHKDNNTISQLKNLNLPNGSTVSLILEAIDAQLGQIQAQSFVLPCLRTTFGFTINGIQQFAQAVDTVLCALNAATALSNTPITPVQSDSIHLTVSGVLNHKLKADVNISATAENQLSILPDGLYAEPQQLSIDYINKTLTISDGNTVSFSSLLCNPSGWLGNLSTDPSSPADGTYWFNTTSSLLKIAVNSGVIKIITTT